jgi:hypothetical protein
MRRLSSLLKVSGRDVPSPLYVVDLSNEKIPKKRDRIEIKAPQGPRHLKVEQKECDTVDLLGVAMAVPIVAAQRRSRECGIIFRSSITNVRALQAIKKDGIAAQIP